MPAGPAFAGGQGEVRNLASSAWTMASCSASSLRASRGRHRPRSSGMEARNKMPPKQIQYQVFYWLAVAAAAFCTAAPCALR